jgi:hypothetical protein
MAGLTQARAAAILDSEIGSSPTVRLLTATGSATAAGTEVTGGSYTAQTATMGSATTATPSVKANSAAVNYTGMPAVTVNGVDVYNGATRCFWGGLTTPRTTLAGDTLSFAIGALSATLQ